MNRRMLGFVLGGLAVALLLAFVVSRYASSQPDGLEKVATENGIASNAEDHALADGPLADYSTRGVEDEGLGTGLAGVIGVALTFAVAGGAVWIVGRSRRSSADDRAGPAAA